MESVTSGEEELSRAEESFGRLDFPSAAAAYLKVTDSQLAPVAKLRLGLIDLAQGRPQQGLESLAQLTSHLADAGGTPHPSQWGAVVLALIANRLVQQAAEALEKYPELRSTVALQRARWLLGILTGAPAFIVDISSGGVEADGRASSRLLGETPWSFEEFVRFCCFLLEGAGLKSEIPKVVNGYLGPQMQNRQQTSRCQLERLGSEYGGWVIPANQLKSDSICYCAGVGEDVSFDLAVLQKYGCHIHAFDPTPRSKEFVSKSVADERYHFHDYGLWSTDTTLTFFAPTNPEHVSHSANDIQSSANPGFAAQVRRLSHIMKELSHPRVDLLKMDIEGAEYPVVQTLLEDRVRVNALCIEYHELPGKPDSRLASILSLLHGGYSLVSIENDNYSFVNT